MVKLNLPELRTLRLCVLGLSDDSVEIDFSEPPPSDGSIEMEYSEPQVQDENVEIEYSEPQDDSDYYEPEWSGEDCSEEELAMANVGRGAGSCNKDCDCPDCAPFCSLQGIRC